MLYMCDRSTPDLNKDDELKKNINKYNMPSTYSNTIPQFLR